MPDRDPPATDDAVTHLTHDAPAAHIPPQEMEPVLRPSDKEPIAVTIAARDPDMDPQLVWRGKRTGPLEVLAPPIYLQEQVSPKALIEDLRADRQRADDLFGHFGLTDEDREAEVEFYRHTRRWANRFILGDSLEVMTSLAEREGLRGQVQAIYVDPPYGIRFNSNFQWSTTSRDVKDGNKDHLTREPEQVRAFRDTWRDGIHSYLGYLRDRLMAARELLTESGSCFVQIGDENVHRVRALMDEVFGEENFVAEIVYVKTTAQSSNVLPSVNDYILWYSKVRSSLKYQSLFTSKEAGEEGAQKYISWMVDKLVRVKPHEAGKFSAEVYTNDNITSQSPGTRYDISLEGRKFFPTGYWKTEESSMPKLQRANRLESLGSGLRYRRYLSDYPVFPYNNVWTDIGGVQSRADPKIYVVQTAVEAIKRCLLMTTDPGDLVLDPTCGSGTTAHVAEQWGRRWIAIDTSRVALALARARVMGAKYPYYLLQDSPEGRAKAVKEGWATPSEGPFARDLRAGFVCERVPHITLKAIANNPAIDDLWDRHQPAVEDALARLNAALRADPPERPFEVTTGGRKGTRIAFTEDGETTMPSGEPAPAGGLMEWEVPRDVGAIRMHGGCTGGVRQAHADFWTARIARQQAIDEAIERKGREDDYEILHDKPFEDRKRIRVAGPFTVESLSPHRTPVTDEHGELLEEQGQSQTESESFRISVLDNLAKTGVHHAGREDRIEFEDLSPWPGTLVTAMGAYPSDDGPRRAAIFLGPEYGTVSRPDLVEAAREAADAGANVLIACAFNFDAPASEFRRLGAIPILHARMHPDMHMAGELKPGGGNLFSVFGEPQVSIEPDGEMVRIRLEGIDIFRASSGRVESASADEITCWFVDTDYSGESFFVRQAYFPNAEVPYKSLRASLKAEVDEDAWDSLKRTVSRPFPKPASGRVAVKVINHLGDEVMKILTVK